MTKQPFFVVACSRHEASSLHCCSMPHLLIGLIVCDAQKRVLSAWRQLASDRQKHAAFLAATQARQLRTAWKQWVAAVVARRRQRCVARYCHTHQALRRFRRGVLQMQQARMLAALRTWHANVQFVKVCRQRAVQRLQIFLYTRAAWVCFEAMKYQVQLRAAATQASRIAAKVTMLRAWARCRRACHTSTILRRVSLLLHEKRVRNAQQHFLRRWRLHCKLCARDERAKHASWHDWRNLTTAAHFRRRKQLAFLQRVLSRWQRLVHLLLLLQLLLPPRL
jgi:hypothetical protein